MNHATKSTFTVAEFVSAHNLSRTHFYGLLKLNKGPRLMRVGRRVLVSAEAAADWRKRMEDETAPWGADACTRPEAVVL